MTQIPQISKKTMITLPGSRRAAPSAAGGSPSVERPDPAAARGEVCPDTQVTQMAGEIHFAQMVRWSDGQGNTHTPDTQMTHMPPKKTGRAFGAPRQGALRR